MFNKNVPAKFQTEKGSTYLVDETGVTRNKVADPTRKTVRKEKNIYYFVDKRSGDLVLQYCDDGWREKNVSPFADHRYHLVLAKGENDGLLQFAMTTEPAIGLTPVDLFLESNGTVSRDSSFHVGDDITKML